MVQRYAYGTSEGVESVDTYVALSALELREVRPVEVCCSRHIF